MIVPMKKIHLIMQKSDMVPALEGLRDLGVVHVEHQKDLTGSRLFVLKEEIVLLKRILRALEPYDCGQSQEPCKTCWTDSVDDILEVISEVELFENSIAKLESQIEQWRPWGDFNPADIRDLASRGIFVHLYKVPVKEKVKVPQDVIWEQVYSDGKMNYCVAIASTNEPLAALTRIYPPEKGLEEMTTLKASEIKKIDELKQRLGEFCKCRNCFGRVLAEHETDLKFEEVACGMKEDEGLVLLKGFCPEDQGRVLEEEAKERKWGIVIDEVSKEDNVPTLLRNPKWIELIKPVFQLIDIVPGYRELDVSFVFLLFFAIFFGILIGDAAYGAILLIATLGAHIKVGKTAKDKSLFYLGYFLSSCTIIWGVLTGTYFGQQWLPGTVQPLLPWLNNIDNIQLLCFIIAAVHLSIAHVWRAVLSFPSPVFLSEVGWLLLVWGMFCVANLFVLGKDFPIWAKLVFYAGTALVILFTKPNINPLKAIGPGLGGFVSKIINTFTDIVSYIRLFAVGLVTVALADTTNQMASLIGFENIFSGLGAVVVLVLGHTLNLTLALLAILVHDIRLNVLEFSGHLNLEWAGFNFTPFRSNKNIQTQS